MNRIEFLKKLGIGVTAIMVAPELIIPTLQKPPTYREPTLIVVSGRRSYGKTMHPYAINKSRI